MQVPVPIQMESNMTWKPSCALVERCGGCCQHESFHCVPTPDGVSVIKKKVILILTILHIELIVTHFVCIQVAILDPKSKYIGMETVRLVVFQTPEKLTFTFYGSSIFSVEKHNKCKCVCKVRLLYITISWFSKRNMNNEIPDPGQRLQRVADLRFAQLSLRM